MGHRIEWFTITRAVLVRLLFITHSLMAIYQVFVKTHRNFLTMLALIPIFFLICETLYTLKVNAGHEWKRFCPSVIIYLLSVVPSIWMMKLILLTGWNIDPLETIETYNETVNKTTEVVVNKDAEEEDDFWLKILEQGLLLLLILGRWILPKGKLTHDQLSQLLLVYIATAADMVEFFDAFKENQVRQNSTLCIIVLTIWSWSLLQFTVVLTAIGGSSNEKIGKVKFSKPLLPLGIKHPGRFKWFTQEVFGIMITIFLQDLPYLIFRLVMIFHYGITSYSNIFFTAKNTLVISLLFYRLIVVQYEHKKQHDNRAISFYHARESQLRIGRSNSYPLHLMSRVIQRFKNNPKKNEILKSVSSNNITYHNAKNDDDIPEDLLIMELEEETRKEACLSDSHIDDERRLGGVLLWDPIVMRKAPHASIESLLVIPKEYYIHKHEPHYAKRDSTSSFPNWLSTVELSHN